MNEYMLQKRTHCRIHGYPNILVAQAATCHSIGGCSFQSEVSNSGTLRGGIRCQVPGLGRWSGAEPKSLETFSQRIWVQSVGTLATGPPGASGGSLRSRVWWRSGAARHWKRQRRSNRSGAMTSKSGGSLAPKKAQNIFSMSYPQMI